MDNQPDPQVVDYLLGEMTPGEQREFEARLLTEPELKNSVRQWQAVLANSMRRDLKSAAPIEELWHRIESRLPAETSAGPVNFLRPAFITALSVAAVLVFGLLLLPGVFRPASGPTEMADDAADSSFRLFAQRLVEEQILEPGEDIAGIHPDELITRLQMRDEALQAREEELAARARTMAELRDQFEGMVHDHQFLAGAYQTLSDRFHALYEEHPGMGRFTIIEMVDAHTYAGDRPRLGIAGRARQAIMGEIGLLAAHDIPYGPNEEWGETYSPSTSLAEAGRLRADLEVDATPVEGELTSRSSLASGVEVDETAFAVMMWVDGEQEGMINIQNLPEIPEGHFAQLWVRGAGREDFILVDRVPPLPNGSGALFYSIQEDNFTPGEVMITLESTAGAGSPSPRILLRGP